MHKFRRFPTCIVSHDMKKADYGDLHVRRMEGKAKLPCGTFGSAYRSAIVNVHPTFYEQASLTYIENLSQGVKTVCSHASSIGEYFSDIDGAQGVYFIERPHFKALRETVIHAI